MRLIELLKQHGLTVSSSEARRVVAMGAVRLNGELQENMTIEVEVKPGDVLEVGRKKVEIKEPIVINTKEQLYEHFGKPPTDEEIQKLADAIENREVGLIQQDPVTGNWERI